MPVTRFLISRFGSSAKARNSLVILVSDSVLLVLANWTFFSAPMFNRSLIVKDFPIPVVHHIVSSYIIITFVFIVRFLQR